MKDNNCIHYRFQHEKKDIFKKIEFVSDYIQADEVKNLILKFSGLGKNLSKMFDLKFFIHEDDNNMEEILDSSILYPGDKIIVKRVPHCSHPAIEHVAISQNPYRNICELENSCGKGILPLPQEYICLLCNNFISNPVLIRCINKCGISVCRKCIDLRFITNKNCPFCNNKIMSIIANKVLLLITRQLKLNDFDTNVTSSILSENANINSSISKEMLNSNDSLLTRPNMGHNGHQNIVIESLPPPPPPLSSSSISPSTMPYLIGSNNKYDHLHETKKLKINNVPDNIKLFSDDHKHLQFSGNHKSDDYQKTLNTNIILNEIPNSVNQQYLSRPQLPSSVTSKEFNNLECPFTFLNDIASRIPFLHKLDFYFIQYLQKDIIKNYLQNL